MRSMFILSRNFMKLFLMPKLYNRTLKRRKAMKNLPRYIVISAGVIALTVLMTASFAHAQSRQVTDSSEYPTAVLSASGVQERAAGEARLTYADDIEEYSTKSTGGIPDFITELSYYTLGKEDILEVMVLRHPEVSGQYIINNEGNIQFEFIGDVKVEGMKKNQVQDRLVRLLEEYIISPIVTVKIVGYNSKIVYVIGEVGRPGKIIMRGDTITVREALVQAGLPMLTAKTSKSHLITPSASGKIEDKIVNVHKLLYEGDLRENLVMKPGDTLYIPPTFLAKTMRVISPVTTPIREVGATTPYGF